MAGPTIRRRQLGKQLRSVREAAKITPKAASDYVGLTTATLSRIETGKNPPKLAVVRLLCQLYGVESPDSDAVMRLAREANQAGWWVSYGDTVPDWFKDYVGLEGDTTELCTYDPELIHGLLQTPDYVRAVSLALRPDATEDELQRSVDLRQARQDKLVAENPPKLTSVLSEGALRRVVGGREAMRHQLDHLLKVSKADNVTLRVLPFEAGAHPAMVSAFTLLQFPEDGADEMAAVYIENDLGALYLERPRDVQHYTDTFARVRDAALSPADSRELIATLMTNL